MAFPTSPNNGQTYGDYVYNSVVGAWEKKSITTVESEISTIESNLNNKADTSFVTSSLGNYYTKSEIRSRINTYTAEIVDYFENANPIANPF